MAILRSFDKENLGSIFWQIVDYEESNNWEPVYNVSKLAYAMAGEAEANPLQIAWVSIRFFQ